MKVSKIVSAMFQRGGATVLPEQEVGAALKKARRAAGISLREMAKRLNYGSHSTLSEYEAGACMPSERVVEAYEISLQLPPGTLTSVLESANTARHGDAWPKRRLHLPLQFTGPDKYPSSTAADAPGPPDSPFPHEPVVDGSDPDAAGCSTDATTIHARRIALTGSRTVIGHVELRYCARTRATWGRFEGYGYLDHLANRDPRIQVAVEIERLRDGARSSCTETYCFDYVWSNLVTVDSGAFQARAHILTGGKTIASGETNACDLG
jgi:transcriptional regulator with XRE-family HTH domain